MTGIPAREIRDVISDLMRQRRVPQSVWSLGKGGVLTILVGDRAVKINCPRGQSFYGMRSALEKIERILDDRERASFSRRQLDIEDVIRSAPQ